VTPHAHLPCIFDAAGRLARFEQFDPDRDDEALRAIRRRRRSGTPFMNAARRAQVVLERAWRDRDWDTVARRLAPRTPRMDDRRPVVASRWPADSGERRMLFDMRDSAWR
jgi:hypothetical protein